MNTLKLEGNTCSFRARSQKHKMCITWYNKWYVGRNVLQSNTCSFRARNKKHKVCRTWYTKWYVNTKGLQKNSEDTRVYKYRRRLVAE